MSSFTRRLELKIARQKGLIPQRNKATLKRKGQPYRNGFFEGETFIRFH